ncbi:dolichyl-phosphate beta-glucosyltransferase [Cadophora gregata]|uniref:dolichyl-phosphate beta-glucosyltransferase n=1 Tax=Cadophora gregata TaxID=51156 RepID=UPI0026DB5A5F|nr:dolichyl-phosphate beta-glucosyltransferase [Cadophora gregata]KAK0111389.1 dolichyl-phosphate beta-glucosyltransferase [Cadophora gregata]KAK0112134.1 dolichyl-phosphate beta-glucosyltransferase [Cadophora gregata f. sp. sojae]
MDALLQLPQKLLWIIYENFEQTPLPILLILAITTAVTVLTSIYAAVYILAPTPRPPFSSEKTYITTAPDGSTTGPISLPCWHDEWLSHRKEAENIKDFSEKHTGDIEEAQLEMSVVIPAYNEEERLEIMLEEAVPFLDAEYGRTPKAKGASQGDASGMGGYEILLVDDGSRDNTVEVALAFSRKHKLHDVLRICKLKENRGKGGAVTHGLRHVRGAFAVFADADGASAFADLAKLVEGCKAVADQPNRAVAVGSRSHLVGSEAVVKRSAIRNVLMHSFHALLKILTPPATSRIRDTQCGFKLFSRAALPHIVPYMHAEGWIFDVEMLMLAESAPPGIITGKNGEQIGTTPGIRVAEVQIGWKEVGGSKLNVIWDSLGMAWGLALLRASWMAGVYRRR